MKRVVVHIDRLVLRGFRSEDRHAFARGLQEELGRVFGDRETVRHFGNGTDVSRLQLAGVRIEQRTTPQQLGEDVARGIGKEIRK